MISLLDLIDLELAIFAQEMEEEECQNQSQE